MTVAVEPGQLDAQSVGAEDFGRTQPFELCRQAVEGAFERPQIAIGQIQPGQPGACPFDMDRQQQTVATVVEQGSVGQCAGSDDTRHGTFDGAFAGCRVTNLFADRHRFAELDQACQIAFDGMVGDAGHRNRLPGRLATTGQGNVEEAGGTFGIGIKQFVEIPHAIEQQHVGMGSLERQVLAHHGRVRG